MSWQYILDAGILAIIISLVIALYRWGNSQGKLAERLDRMEKGTKEKIENMDIKINDLNCQFKNRDPLPECQTLFRQLSKDTAEIKGMLSIIINEMKK